MSLDIRPYQPTDIGARHRICLPTGWRGLDATPHYSDLRVLGDFYAAPYVSQDPGLCLIPTRSLAVFRVRRGFPRVLHVDS